MNAEELAQELIASLYIEARQINSIQSYLRSDHTMSAEAIRLELDASQNRRYSLYATFLQVTER